MDAEWEELEKKKLKLLQQLADLEVQQFRHQGKLDKVPHFSEIEDAGQSLGRSLSRFTQSRLANEIAAGEPQSRDCPSCGQSCPVEFAKRTVTGLDGPIEILEPKAHCPACRRDFFPSA